MRQINWGVIGTARIAKGKTIPGMQMAENAKLYAIAGRNIDKANLFKEEFGFEKAYGSYEELLEDPQVEAVYIALPNDLHCEWTVKAANAGKHILCEKPLARTEEELGEMFAAAKANHVCLMEAFAYLHTPFQQAIRKEIKSGTIGRVLYMESEFLTSDYMPSNIRMRRDTYGGCTYDLGVYAASQILWAIDEMPERVQAVAEFGLSGVDVLTTGLMKFPGGARAKFTSGMLLATEKHKGICHFGIHGTEGKITSPVMFNQMGDLSYTIEKDDEVITKTVSVKHNYCLEVEQLGRCIIDGEMPLVSEDFSRRLSHVIDSILNSINY